jgi:hypothetical protein
MAGFFGELLIGIGRAFIGRWLYSLFVMLAAWLDPMVHTRALKIVVGLLLGVAAYFVIPLVIGLLSF